MSRASQGPYGNHCRSVATNPCSLHLRPNARMLKVQLNLNDTQTIEKIQQMNGPVMGVDSS